MLGEFAMKESIMIGSWLFPWTVVPEIARKVTEMGYMGPVTIVLKN